MGTENPCSCPPPLTRWPRPLARPFDLDEDFTPGQKAAVEAAARAVLGGKDAAAMRGYNSTKFGNDLRY